MDKVYTPCFACVLGGAFPLVVFILLMLEAHQVGIIRATGRMPAMFVMASGFVSLLSIAAILGHGWGKVRPWLFQPGASKKAAALAALYFTVTLFVFCLFLAYVEGAWSP
jgi:hypothetical protein